MRANRWALALITAGLPVCASAAQVWDDWSALLGRTCPSYHVELISDNDHDELIGGFFRTLPAATQGKVNAIADYNRRCSKETMGFYCEMAVDLDAFERLGLLKRFAGFACHAR